MATHTGSFSMDAVVVGGRVRHHRTHDHIGPESSQFVVTEITIGPWMAGTPIHWVLDDILKRVAALESAYHVFGSFTVDALIPDYFPMDAVIFEAGLGTTFTINAWKNKGTSFTFDAVLRGGSSFTVDAVLV